MYICLCKGLTESDIQRAVQSDQTPEALTTALGLDDDDCCGRCAGNIDQLAACAATGCLRAAG